MRAPTSSTPRSCAAPPCRSPRSWAGRSSPRARASCPTRSSAGRRSRRRTPSSKLRQEVQDRADLEHRRQAARPDAPALPHDFDLVVTAQQVRSYKPDPAHFKESERRIGGKKGWVHVASSYYHDVEPLLKSASARRLGQPPQGDARVRPEGADAEVANLREAAKLLGALGRGARARGRRPRGRPRRDERRSGGRRARRCAAGGEGFLIDSPVLPGRARGCCPRCSSRRGSPDERAARHARRLGPPARPPRVPRRRPRLRRDDRRAAARRAGRRPAPAARVRREHYLERPAPLSLGQVQALPVPGHLELGDGELELHPADGHTTDGMAIWVPWAEVPGPRRLPLAGRDPHDLRRRLARRLPGDAAAPASRSSSRRSTIVPGHGGPLGGARAARDPRARTWHTSRPAGRDAAARAAPPCPRRRTSGNVAAHERTLNACRHEEPEEEVAGGRVALGALGEAVAVRTGAGRRHWTRSCRSSTRRQPRARARSSASSIRAPPRPAPRASSRTNRSSSQQSSAAIHTLCADCAAGQTPAGGGIVVRGAAGAGTPCLAAR